MNHSSIFAWWRRVFQSNRRPAPVRRPSLFHRPGLEVLEDRVVPSVSYHNGWLLTNVHVATFYYGSAWGTDSSLIALRNRLDAYVSFLVNSPYMDMLSQYYQTGPSFDPPNVGRGQFVGDYYGYWTNGGPTGIPRNSYGQAQDQDIGNLLLNGINSSPGSSFHLPSLKNYENLWLVFLPPGVAEDKAVHDSDWAYHGSFLNPNGAPDSAVTYTIQDAVFPYPGGVNPMVRNLPNPFDNLTGFISHEVAEAVTDPNSIWDNTAGLNPGGGWWDNSKPKDGEIGDLANMYYSRWNGYVVQGEWSNVANGIVYPFGASPLDAGSNFGGSGNAEQIGAVTGGPSAGPLTYAAVTGTSLAVAASNGVLTGASDGFGNPLTASLVGSPSHGSVTLNPDGSFTYVPAPGFTGTDTFSYQVTDGAFVSDPATVTLDVAPAVTTTTLTTSASSVQVGQMVTFTASVSGSGSGNPTGNVTFYLDGSTALGTVGLDASGTASFSTSTLGLGSHSILAQYAGDRGFQSSYSTWLAENVTAPTSTSLTASAAALTPGQLVTFTATVSGSGAGNPSGNVTFYDGGTALGTVGLDAADRASFSTSTLGVGSHSITAAYAGAGTFQASTSAAVMETITAAATSTSVSASAASAVSGQPVTFTATVSGSGTGNPSGNVTFYDGGTALGTVGLDASDTASFSTSALDVGSHSITAAYAGDGTSQASTSAAVTETITSVATTTSVATSTSVSASAASAVSGQPVTFTATVSGSGTGNPSGNVTFYDGSTALGTVGLNSSDTASFSTSTLGVGSHSITAAYAGDGTFQDSRSAPLTETVAAPPSAHAKAAIGVFDPSTATWYLRGSASAGGPNAGQFQYGAPGWLAIVGDWTGRGQSGIGVYDPATATWYLRHELSAGAPDAGQFRFGAPGWIPLVGDWTGSGHIGIGVYDPATATFYLRNEASAGAPDVGQFAYGVPGWLPLVGDWNGSGKDGIGVFDPSTATFYLRNEASGGGPDAGRFAYGVSGWLPLVGDWSGSGKDGIGMVDPSTGTWYLRKEASAGAPDVGPFAYGAPGWQPLEGVFGSAPSAPTSAAHPLLGQADLMAADPFQADNPSTEALDRVFGSEA